MEGPEARQHPEAHHQERKEDPLKIRIERDLLERYQVKRPQAGLDEYGQQSDPDEDAAPHQVQHQLHCAVLFRAGELTEG